MVAMLSAAVLKYSYLVCTLIFTGFKFRGFFIFMDFTFLNCWPLFCAYPLMSTFLQTKSFVDGC